MVQQKSKTRNPLPWVRSHKLLSLLFIIVLLAAGVFVYEKVATELNKRAFAHARIAIDSIYTDIVKEVGPADEYKVSNFCSRPSVTFGQGPLSCDVGTKFIYGVSDINQANGYLKSIQYTIGNDKDFKTTQPLAAFITSAAVGNETFTSATDRYETSGNIDCTFSYWYDTPRQTDLAIKDVNKKPLEIVLHCDGSAKNQYYPLSH